MESTSLEGDKKVDSTQEDYKEGELCTYKNGNKFEYVKKVFSIGENDVYLVKTQIQLKAKREGPNIYIIPHCSNLILKSIKISGFGEFKYCIASEDAQPIGFLAQESTGGYLDMFSAQNSGVLKQYNGDSIESDTLSSLKSSLNRHDEVIDKLFPNQEIWLHNKVNPIICFKTDPGKKEINCDTEYYNVAFSIKSTKKFIVLRYSY